MCYIYRCDQCHIDFTARTKLKDHMRIHKKVKCDHCDEIVPYNNMKNHKMQNHDPERELRCNNCPYICKRVDNLKRHIKTCSKKEEKTNSFICSDCGKQFTRLSSLKDHQELHNKNESKKQRIIDYNCDVCEQKFTEV